MNLSDYKPVESCQIPGLEIIYENVFGLKTDGLFVEVGAFDGKTYSNTYQLAALGWKGIYIEPVYHLFEACVANHADHSNIEVVQAFVSDNDYDMIAMYKWGDNTFTGNIDFIQHVANNQVVRLCDVPTTTLSTLLRQVGLPLSACIDLMVIDVEGHELQVLEGINILQRLPTMFIIETHELSDHKGLRMHADAIKSKMKRLGYKYIYADAINSIFVKEWRCM